MSPPQVLQKSDSTDAVAIEVVHPSRRLRAEANFLKFPFFDLARESTKTTRDTVEVRETILGPDGSKTEILWEVLRAVKTPFPGELARRIHREVVERIISDLPRPVRNPIRLGSFRDICARLEIRVSGRSANNIRTALHSILAATVRSKSTFFRKARKGYIDDSFHLYDRVAFTGDELPDGKTADAVYVVLGSWYLENLNANYVVPLDFTYYRQIKGAIALRLYELLHHWFFIALINKQGVVERHYSTLCSYFPLTRQDSLWKARKQMREAHAQHHQAGFLATMPEWRATPGTSNDWTLVYTAGPKAHNEFRRNQMRRKDQEAIAPDELPAASQLLLPSLEDAGLAEVQRDLARELGLRGITEGVALELARVHLPVQLTAQIEAFDWLVGKGGHISQNPAGYLRTAIEENYAPPAGYVSREEKQRKAAEEATRLKAEQEAKTKVLLDREERASRLAALFASLPVAEQDALRQRALATQNPFALSKIREEERDGRSGVGHIALQQEIYKILEAEKSDRAKE